MTPGWFCLGKLANGKERKRKRRNDLFHYFHYSPFSKASCYWNQQHSFSLLFVFGSSPLWPLQGTNYSFTCMLQWTRGGFVLNAWRDCHHFWICDHCLRYECWVAISNIGIAPTSFSVRDLALPHGWVSSAKSRVLYQMRSGIVVIVGFVIVVCAMNIGRQFPTLGLRRHLFQPAM